jgi:hypothetical protein
METKTIPLLPIAGMNSEYDDDALVVGGDARRIYVRDALNIDISPRGKVRLRKGAQKVTDQALSNIWQSPLHGDVFGTKGSAWGRISPDSWEFTPLAEIGSGPISHEILNNLVAVAGPAGIFTYDGAAVRRLGIMEPPAPLVTDEGGGALGSGSYGVAVSYLRGAQESGLSAIAQVSVTDGAFLSVWLAPAVDPTATGIRLYMTRQNGGELARVGDYPASGGSERFSTVPTLGMPPQFMNKSQMPTGGFLRYWRGRLLTASRNVLRWSEPMAYHLHDPRYGWLQMPQRITFVAPVDGGIWIGQVDHVAFLSGSSPDSLQVQRLRSQAPVPGSAIILDSDTAGDAAQGGQATALWLAGNGYVLGTASGQIIELHKGVMGDIAADFGQSVVFDGRVITVVR